MKKLGLVRSGLEYAAMIWDPHLATQKSIEQVQHGAITVDGYRVSVLIKCAVSHS